MNKKEVQAFFDTVRVDTLNDKDFFVTYSFGHVGSWRRIPVEEWEYHAYTLPKAVRKDALELTSSIPAAMIEAAKRWVRHNCRRTDRIF